MKELYYEDRLAIVRRMLNEQSVRALNIKNGPSRQRDFVMRMISVLDGVSGAVPRRYRALIGKRRVRR